MVDRILDAGRIAQRGRRLARSGLATLATAACGLLAFAPGAAAQDPQVEKAFSPLTVTVGQTTTLRFEISNPDLGPKTFSFVDELDTGLRVASTSATTDCPATTVDAPLDASTIDVSGTLAAGQAACTIAVELQATRAGTLINGAANFTSFDGIVPPVQDAELACDPTDPDLAGLGVFSSCPFNDDPPVFDFEIREAWQTAGATTIAYQTPVVGDVFGTGAPAVVIGANRTATAVTGSVHAARVSRDIHVYDGASGDLLHTITTPRYSWATHTAVTIADVTGDGRGEIIFRTASHNQTQDDADAAGVAGPADIAGRLVAYAYDPVADDWDVLWVSGERYDHVPDVGETSGARTGHGVGVADFDGDGIPEAYVGNQIFNARTGTRIAAGDAGDPSGCAFSAGTAHCTWGQVVAADMDGDGTLELVAGNAVYKVEINDPDDESANVISIWREADPTNADVRDGFTAVADMDLDGTPDVIVSGRLGGETSATVLYVWDGQTGVIKAMRTGFQMVGSNGSRGGPPMIGDIDGDGRPEVVVVTTNRVRAFQVVPGAGTLADALDEEWTLTVSDGSGATSMSMFDFNNNGRQEIVYRDESSIRILDGTATPDDPVTRNLALFSCSSSTGMELPVIADIDGSGDARILVTCGVNNDNNQSNVRAYESDSFPWAPTRPVWNQQSYFVAHVNDDLSIPASQFEHWSVFSDPHERCSDGANRPLNAFQQQVTDLDGETGCPVQCVEPELEVTKTSDPPSGSIVGVGDVIAYEIEIANTSDGHGFGIEVVDDLGDILDDAEITSGPTLSPAGAGTVEVRGTTLTYFGHIFRGETVTIAYEVTVNSAGELGDGVLGNVVTAEHSACPGEEGCATEHLVAALSKEADSETVIAGTELTYTYTLTGPGWVDADVSFTDVLPAGMTYVPGGVEVSPPFGAVGAYGGTDTLEVAGTVDAVPVTITAAVAIAADVTCDSELPNQSSAIVRRAGEPDATVASDDPATAAGGDATRVTAACEADLALEKSAPAIVAVGGEVTWTLTVSNDGPSASPGATVTDLLPVAVVDPRTATDGCAIAGRTVTCDVGPIGADETFEIVVTGEAPTTYSTCFANEATVTGDAADPVSSDNTASVTTCTPPVANLALEKSAANVVEPDEPFAWTITVTNHGPDPSSGAVVTDELPAAVSDAQTDTEDCVIDAGVLRCEVPPLAVTETHEIVVTATAPATPSTCIENRASVEGNEHDPDLAGNEAHVRTCTIPVANLDLQKSAPSEVDPNGTVTWTLTVTNEGPNPSSGAVVTDELPAAVSDAQTDTEDCVIDAGVLRCEVPPLAVTETHEIVVTATAPATASTCVVNEASVEGIEGDYDLSNTVASIETCTPPPPAPPSPPSPGESPPPPPSSPPSGVPDLGVLKSGPARVRPGARIDWTITVTNHGPVASTGARVTDTLPARVRDAEVTTPGCELSGRRLTCAVGPLAVGESAAISLGATAPQRSGTTVVNRVSVSGEEPDPNPANDADSARTRTRGRAVSPRLVVRKRAGTRVVRPASVVTYRIAVANRGRGIARRVRVCDRPPAELAVIRAPGARRATGGAVCWTLARLRPGSSERFRVIARVGESVEPGPLRNRAVANGRNASSAAGVAGVRVTRTAGACSARVARASC